MKQQVRVWRQSLLTLGLSDKEAIIYELLIEQGEMVGSEIERLTKLKKNTYTLLKSLERKRLLLGIMKEGRRYYQPASPEKLMSLVTEQKRALLQGVAMLERVMPEMLESYRQRIGKPVVQYYQGIDGLRTVFDEVYREGKSEVWGAFGNETPDVKFFDEIVNKYEPLRVKNKLFAYTISPDSKRARELKGREKQDLKEKFLVDPVKYPMPAEFDVWDDKIAMMSFRKGEFAAMLIQYPEFATTLLSILRLAMDLLRSQGSADYIKNKHA